MPSSADERGLDGATGRATTGRKTPTRRKHMTRAERRAANDPPPRYICPCCDYVTLAERGRCLICPICFWEDEDVYHDTDMEEPSAANHGLALSDARRSFQRIGAYEPSMVKHVLPAEKRSEYLHFPRQD
ncbi:hypothetical protein TRL7639_01280 [Falsiruegeria litorea R37]|uniref:Cysteine-rich CPCC domain-containing protein n=1 Tax=Falsiruegeria litorea R37 TaxID=1200284 RepID=A0A1Y5S235_9RHOB|nr:CPCC family cysteine-rich protein [Falsiruegeria litorea]SLN30804.1 hypothetical protein TRL7639_01280 [Falsiruegeria litorea R37]